MLFESAYLQTNPYLRVRISHSIDEADFISHFSSTKELIESAYHWTLQMASPDSLSQNYAKSQSSKLSCELVESGKCRMRYHQYKNRTI